MQTIVQTSSSTSAAAAPDPKKHGWLGRNWMRLLLAVVLLAVVLGGTGGYLYKFGPILFSAPYRQAMAELRQSQQVKKLLGEPIHDGWFPAGGVNTDEGEATLYFKVRGPKTTDGAAPMADISAQARCVDGKWDFTQFDIATAAGQKLNLMDEISAEQPPDVKLFDGQAQQPAPEQTEATPQQDVNIQIPDMPSDSGQK